MGYVISPGCTGPQGETLALAAMDDGTICVQAASEITIQLVWSLVYDLQSAGFAMVSLNSVESGTPMVLALANTGGGTSALALSSYLSGLPAGSTWNVASGGAMLAVRPTFNTSFNLNVEGGGTYAPGNPVIAYDGWGGGQPNEIWTFTQIGTPDYPWNYFLTPNCNSATMLTANPDDSNGQLTIQPAQGLDVRPSPAQLWSANYSISGVVVNGVVFVNQELSMALATAPGGGPVFCADLAKGNTWSTWVVAPAPDPNSWELEPVGSLKLALNAAGGGPYNPGNPVITYPWQGGAENEQWTLTFVPHEVT